MDAQVIGHPLDELPVAEHQAGHPVEAGRFVLPRAKGIDLGLGQPEDLAQFADDAALPEGHIGAQQGNVLETTEYVAGNFFPVPPREVDVKIGRVGPEQVDEPLEIQVELNGVHIGDAQQVGHDAVGPAPPPHVEETPAPGFAHNVPVDEEIGDEPLLLDQVELLFKAAVDFRAGIAVAVGHPLPAKAFEQGLVFFPAAGVGLQVLGGARLREIEVDAAAVHQGLRVLENEGVLRKGGRQVGHRVHAIFGVGLLRFGQLAEQGVVVDGPQQAVRVEVALVAEGHRLQHHQPVAVFDQVGKGQPPQVAHRDPDILMGGKIFHFGQQHCLKGIDRHGIRKGRGPLRQGPLLMQVGREETVELQVPLVVAGDAHKAGGNAVAEVDPQQGPQIELRGPAHKIQPGRGVVDIGEGQAAQPALLGQFQQFQLGEGAVAQTVICMTV